MKISRRNFLRAFSASVAAALPLTGTVTSASGATFAFGFADRSRYAGNQLARLGWSSFYQYVNTEFEFSALASRSRSEVVRLTLSGMTPYDEGIKGGEPRCFLLSFRGPATASSPRLAQNTYSVEHFGLGRFDLFISEGSFLDGEDIYTAVINRITE